MADFDQSRWADDNFSRNYRDDADIYLPERQRFIDLVLSFYDHFLASNQAARVLDLGCGDGLFVGKLLQRFSPAELTLVDGSEDMLTAAWLTASVTTFEGCGLMRCR